MTEVRETHQERMADLGIRPGWLEPEPYSDLVLTIQARLDELQPGDTLIESGQRVMDALKRAERAGWEWIAFAGEPNPASCWWTDDWDEPEPEDDE